MFGELHKKEFLNQGPQDRTYRLALAWTALATTLHHLSVPVHTTFNPSYTSGIFISL